MYKAMSKDSLEEESTEEEQKSREGKQDLSPRSNTKNVFRFGGKNEHKVKDSQECDVVTVPYYSGDIPLTYVRTFQESNKKKYRGWQKNRRYQQSIFPPAMKELDNVNLVCRWLYQSSSNNKNKNKNNTTTNNNKQAVNTGGKKEANDVSACGVNELQQKIHNLRINLQHKGCVIVHKTKDEADEKVQGDVSRPSMQMRQNVHESKQAGLRRTRSSSYLGQFYDRITGYYERFHKERVATSSVIHNKSNCSLPSSTGDNRSSYTTTSTEAEEEEIFYQTLIALEEKAKQEQQQQRQQQQQQEERPGKDINSSGQLADIKHKSKSECTTCVNRKDAQASISGNYNSLRLHRRESTRAPFLSKLLEVDAERRIANYKPYSLKDYKSLQVPNLGRLGPDLMAAQEKAERMRRQWQYGETASTRNRQRLSQKRRLKYLNMAGPPPQELIGQLPFHQRDETETKGCNIGTTKSSHSDAHKKQKKQKNVLMVEGVVSEGK